jgi:hypothetical protein
MEATLLCIILATVLEELLLDVVLPISHVVDVLVLEVVLPYA